MECNDVVAVYILTHNRPETVMRALDSVRKQTFQKIKIIVSDNSDDKRTAELVLPVAEVDSRLEYQYRTEPLCHTGNGHLNYILNNTPYDYFVMFHDDDEMLPNMVQLLYESIKSDSSIVAVGCNAWLNVNGRNTKRKANSIKKILKATNPITIVEMYVNRTIAPFPSYMYNKSLVLKSPGLLLSLGGKYSDSSFIADLAKIGIVEMLPDCGMTYYVTNQQDSYTHEFQQYDSLLNYWRNSYGCKNILKNARIYNIYSHLKSIQLKSGTIPFKKRYFFLLLRYSTMNYFPKYLLRLLKIKNN